MFHSNKISDLINESNLNINQLIYNVLLKLDIYKWDYTIHHIDLLDEKINYIGIDKDYDRQEYFISFHLSVPESSYLYFIRIDEENESRLYDKLKVLIKLKAFW